MPEMGYRPTNKYLPPRPRAQRATPEARPAATPEGKFLAWVDRLFSH